MFGLRGEHICRIPILHSNSVLQAIQISSHSKAISQLIHCYSIKLVLCLTTKITNMEMAKSNAQSMARSPIDQRGALIDQNADHITSSGNPMQRNFNPGTPNMNQEEFERFTGAGHGRRLRRMRHIRRKMIEQQRMLTTGSDSSSTSPEAKQAEPQRQRLIPIPTISTGRRPILAGSNKIAAPAASASTTVPALINDDFRPSDEERINSGVSRFLFENDNDQEIQRQTAAPAEGFMNFGSSIRKTEGDSEYRLEKPSEVGILFNDLNDQTSTEAPQPESARMRGQHQPLTIAPPNTDAGFNGILAKNYEIYTMDSVQYTNAPVYFYIEPKLTYGLYTVPFKPHHFAIKIATLKDNLSLTFPVHVDDDDYMFEAKETGEFGGPLYQKRLKCRFEPSEPGTYPITVCLAKYGHVWNPQHIEGSPLSVTVKNNVKNIFAKPIELAYVPVTPRLPAPSQAPFPKGAARLTPAAAKTGSLTPRFKSPAKRHGSTPTNNASTTPAKVARPMSMMEVTNLNGMYYFNHRPILVKTSPPVDPSGNTKPWGMTYCPRTDEIFVAARDLHQIQGYSAATGQYVGHFGSYGSGPSCFFRPTGIVYDQANDRLVISDKDNHRVCFYSVTGQFLSTFGANGHYEGGLNYPWGIDVSRDGTLIAVADSRNHRIQIFSASGQYLRKFSVFEVNPFEYKDIFNYPRGVCFDNSGKFIYVSDFNNNAVFMLNVECTVQSVVTPRGQCLRPQGLTVDIAGNIFICDTRRLCIRVVRPDGTLLSTIEGFGRPNNHQQGGQQPGHDEFIRQDVPIDLCFVRSGKLAVLDANGLVRIF